MKAIFRSIQFSLTFAMSVVALVAMVVVSLLVYDKVVRSMEETLSINSAQMVNQVSNTIYVYAQDMIDVTDQIVGGINTYNSPNEKLRELLDSTTRVRSDIASVTIVNARGDVLAFAPSKYTMKENVDVLSQDWYPQSDLSDSDYYFTPPHVQNLFEGQYSWVVTLCRNITMHDISGDGNREYSLTLIMDMNFESIEKYCSELRIGKRGYVFILDKDNNLVYHPQQHVIYSGMKTEDLAFYEGKQQGTYVQGDGKIVTIEPIQHTGWKLVGISYMDDYQTIYREIIIYSIFAFAAVMVMVLALSNIISRRISSPIKRLARRMEKVEAEAFSNFVPEEGFDEVRRLSVSFNKMNRRIGELMEQIKREEQELRKSELRALQAQINPHFLYNTLDSILWMCEQGDGPRAVTMVSALSRLFRISISKGAEIITIREELVHATSYLTIQQIRYRDQFDCILDVDESLLDYKCMKITFQPLLENAIYHGIDRMVDKGTLAIRVEDRGDKILMQVIDNGLGMDPEVLQNIWNPQKEQKHTYGIGVANVNNRIQIYFGREYGLQLESVPDEGTTVNIWLPKIKGDVELA